MPPLVSVIITTYNQAAFISEAVKSVLGQTYKPFEVIVVDDGSTDRTEARIEQFKDRIRYIYQANHGVAGSRNTGIRNAHGDLIALLDGDDIWESDKLALQVEGALRYPHAGLIVVNGTTFNESGPAGESLIGLRLSSFMENKGDGLWVGKCHRQLLEKNFIYTTSQVMIPSRILHEVGESDRRFKIASDYDLYLRILARYELTIIDRPLVRWRYHSESASGPPKLKPFYWYRDSIAVWKKHLHLVPAELRLALRQQIHDTLMLTVREAYYYGRRTNRRWTIRYLFELLLQNPTSCFVAIFLFGLCIPSHATDFWTLILRKFRKCMPSTSPFK